MNLFAGTSRARLMLAAIGAIAFVVACVSHEVIGHGGACVAAGGRVWLLTSVFFRCDPSPWFVDAAGPAMNAFVALVSFAILARWPRLAAPWHLLFVFLFAFNGGWAAGYAIYSAVSSHGDLAFIVRDAAAPSAMPMRFALATGGLFAYAAVARAAIRRMSVEVPVVAACVAAIALGCLAAACFAAAPAAALKDGLLEGVGATLGLLLATRRPLPHATSHGEFVAARGFSRWVFAAALLAVIFVGVLGRGIGDPTAIDPPVGSRK